MPTEHFGGVQEITAAFAPRSYYCPKAAERCEINGNLDKPFWRDAPWSEAFEDIEDTSCLIAGGAPSPRPRPAFETRMKMKWDDQYLYIGALLEDTSIWANQTDRDSCIYLDNDFEVFLDPDGDTHNYLEFEMNARNTVWDLLMPRPYRDGGPYMNAFDIQGVKTAVHIDGALNDPTVPCRSWSVEIAFPFDVLCQCAETRPEAGVYWRINFSRVEWRAEAVDGAYRKVINPETNRPYPEDNWIWSPTGIVDMHCPERWGFLVFVDQIPDTPFAIPRDEYIKWELRKIYYRERNFYARTGRFTDDFTDLTGNDQWSISPRLAVTPHMFEATAGAADGTGIWCIRQDGKIYLI